MGIAAANHLLQIGKGKEGDEAHGIGTDHAVGGKLVFLVVVGGHHSKQRSVRHIDGCIDRHHQEIERIGPDALAHGAELRSVEEQGEDEAEGYGSEEEPGAIRSPARLRAVSQRAHERVGDDVEQACHEHQRGGVGHGQTEDVGEKEGESDGHHLPRDSASSGIAQGIADFL